MMDVFVEIRIVSMYVYVEVTRYFFSGSVLLCFLSIHLPFCLSYIFTFTFFPFLFNLSPFHSCMSLFSSHRLHYLITLSFPLSSCLSLSLSLSLSHSHSHSHSHSL